MAHPREEEELFESLKGIDEVSIDPELAIILELVAIAQRRLDDHPEVAEETLNELNAQFPWIDESVNITGEVFGPRRNNEGAIESAGVHYIDEEVVAKGFKIIHQPIFVDGMQVAVQPIICYVFLVDTEYKALSENGLLTGKHFFHAVGYINSVHVEPIEHSRPHYANVVREFALEYMKQVDSIVSESTSTPEMMMRLGEISITPPKNDTEREALQALIEYVSNVLKIDKNLPYYIELSGTFFTNLSNAIETDESYDDFELDLEEGETLSHVDSTGDAEMAVLGNVRTVMISNVPTLIGNEFQASPDFAFVYEVDLFGTDQSRDFMQKVGIPASHITSIYAERDRHKDALV